MVVASVRDIVAQFLEFLGIGSFLRSDGVCEAPRVNDLVLEDNAHVSNPEISNNQSCQYLGRQLLVFRFFTVLAQPP
jgi:hypothetical protein